MDNGSSKSKLVSSNAALMRPWWTPTLPPHSSMISLQFKNSSKYRSRVIPSFELMKYKALMAWCTAQSLITSDSLAASSRSSSLSSFALMAL
eukprot:9865392-Ditylum_brightwellii.AAC.1